VPLAGCDLRPQATTPTPPPPTADERLVEETAAAIRAARDVAAVVPEGRQLAGVHEAHLAALGAASAPSAPADPASADLHATEAGLESALTDAAARAGDGALARLLASMASSVAQHLAVLPHPKATR